MPKGSSVVDFVAEDICRTLLSHYEKYSADDSLLEVGYSIFLKSYGTNDFSIFI